MSRERYFVPTQPQLLYKIRSHMDYIEIEPGAPPAIYKCRSGG